MTSNAVNESQIREKYKKLTENLIKSNTTITTMESCTSGQIASLITDTEGASAIFTGACITYSNKAKEMAGVSASVIDKFGVYSNETAIAMAQTCQKAFNTDIGIGVTGSFGNVDPNNADSVPGEVFFAIAQKKGTESFHYSIPLLKTRLEYKLYIADVIADKLLSLLAIK